MNQSQMFNEAMRVLADPKALAAIQAAASPLLEQIQKSTNGADPLTSLTSLMKMMNLGNPETAKPEEEKPSTLADQQANIGRVFMHTKTSNIYILVSIANLASEDAVKFPPTALYMNCVTREMWARPLAEFVTKFELV